MDRLTQHSTSINNTLKKRKKTENVNSSLSEHTFNNPDHTVLFNQANLISHDKGNVQHCGEADTLCGYLKGYPQEMQWLKS